MESAGDRIYALFDGRKKASLSALSLALLASQKMVWPQLQAGYDALDSRLERRLDAGELAVVLQCNPQRIVSTGADIDPGAIQARPCFLCPANRPAAQQAIVYHRPFLVLCNPFPIVPRHFTVAHREHRPQSLHSVLPTFLQLARDFHPDYAVLYNGPQSGASAPDHLHLQVLPTAAIPALNEGRGNLIKVIEIDGISLFKKIDGVRTALLVEGTEAKNIVALIRKLIRAMQSVQPSPTERLASLQQVEPMLNLFCLYGEGRWRVMLFPRRRHRPDAYYKSGADQLLVSPGAVDMGGLLVLPRQVDYDRLDAALLMKIFQDVSLDETSIDKIVAAV